MRRVAIWSVLPCVVLTLTYCSSFESSPGDGPDAAASDASDARLDGSVTEIDAALEAATEAGPRLGRCGVETCSLPSEVCCLYRVLSNRRFDCVLGDLGDCEPDRDAGEATDVASECDDPTDCAPGLVCCHQYPTNPTSMNCGSHPKFAKCVRADACPLCATDAGSGRIACDPSSLTSQCPFGLRCDTVVANVANIAHGYCVP